MSLDWTGRNPRESRPGEGPARYDGYALCGERPSDGNRAATETLPRFGAQPTGNRRD
jgi:hypothetical protein